MQSNTKDPKKKKSTGEINTYSWDFNIGLQQLKGIPNVATGLKGIKEWTHKNIQLNNKKCSAN